MLTKTCAVSGQDFVITDEDLVFYEKMGVPAPTLCPEERQRRRLSWRNERNLYRRKCDMTGREIISIYDSSAAFPVYNQTFWWSDEFDGLNSGRDFDFSRPFFSQFRELLLQTPQMSVVHQQCENSDYSSGISRSKNCYYSFYVHRSENIFYSQTCTSDNNFLCDCFCCYNSSYLYECVECHGCHNASYLYLCNDSYDLDFSIDCIGCDHCLFCSNLRQKSYYIHNRPVSKSEFETYRLKLSGSHELYEQALLQFEKLKKNAVYRNFSQKNCEDSTGDYLRNSKNLKNCFNCVRAQDCKFCVCLTPSKCAQDYYDVYGGGIGELLYECASCGGTNYKLRFCCDVRSSKFATYSFSCFGSENLFGCVGLKHKKNCIFNQAYTKQEFDVLSAKIEQHMKESGEWGEFFPAKLSPFAYNQSVAADYFPMEKDLALSRGYQWKKNDIGGLYEGPILNLPDKISDTDESICDKILTCSASERNYRITKPEFEFYKKQQIPIPRICPDERHNRRLRWQNPQQIFDRKCGRCDQKIKTTFAPDRPEEVYCENCYLNSLQ